MLREVLQPHNTQFRLQLPEDLPELMNNSSLYFRLHRSQPAGNQAAATKFCAKIFPGKKKDLDNLKTSQTIPLSSLV